LFRRLQCAALSAVRMVPEELPVPWAVRAVGALAELAAHEPSVGSGRWLIDAADAGPSNAARSGSSHLELEVVVWATGGRAA
jgi:hypothetical protein